MGFLERKRTLSAESRALACQQREQRVQVRPVGADEHREGRGRWVTSLVYRASYRTAKAVTQRNPVLEAGGKLQVSRDAGW